MNIPISVKTYTLPPIDKNEVKRYLLSKSLDENGEKLLESCIDEVREILTFKVCYAPVPLEIHDDICDFSYFKWRSRKLSENLAGCSRAMLFGGTVGMQLDRLISKYSRLSPARALMLSAVGNERIEALCDVFCKDMGIIRPRFSSGYGDLLLETQKDIFNVLDLTRKIGLYLTDSMLMSPSKSVTGIAGLE